MSNGRKIHAKLIRTATAIANDATWVFVIVVAISVLSSFSSISYLSGLNGDLDDMYEKDIKGQTYTQSAFAALIGIESTIKDLALAETDAERTASANELRAQNAALRSLVLKVTTTFDAAKYRTLIATSKVDALACVDMIQKELGPAGSGAPDKAAARALLYSLAPSSTKLKGDLNNLNDIKRRSNRAWFRAIKLQLRLSLYATVAILVISIGVRVFLWLGQRRARRTSRSS